MKSSHTSDSNLQACFCASSDIVIEKDGQFDTNWKAVFFSPPKGGGRPLPNHGTQNGTVA